MPALTPLEMRAVENEVIAAIDQEAGRNKAPEGKRQQLRAHDKTLVLEDDLNIGLTRRKALSADYTAISQSQSYPDGLMVGPVDAGNAVTVDKAVKLVQLRASGNTPPPKAPASNDSKKG